MSINTYTECTCDRCGDAMQMSTPRDELLPPRWMRVRTTTTKKGTGVVVAAVSADDTRIVCPSCAALVAEVLAPLRRKKKRTT